MKATARAQSASGQEYADFFSSLGIGTYADQANALFLPGLVPDLTGFEGGFAMNISDGTNVNQYGILVPYHNGVVSEYLIICMYLHICISIYLDISWESSAC